MAQWVERRNYDQQVVGSIPTQGLGQVVHTYVTKQYNLVPA